MNKPIIPVNKKQYADSILLISGANHVRPVNGTAVADDPQAKQVARAKVDVCIYEVANGLRRTTSTIELLTVTPSFESLIKQAVSTNS